MGKPNGKEGKKGSEKLCVGRVIAKSHWKSCMKIK